MSSEARSIALLVAGIAFVAFVVLQLLGFPRLRRDTAATAEARRRLAEHKAQARRPDLSKADRVAALRAAAEVALTELGRPGLAASFARRAERLDPADLQSVGLLVRTLRAGSRLRALEDLLWTRLSEAERDSAYRARVLEELVALYEGPLRRRTVAHALRRLGASKIEEKVEAGQR